MTTRSLRFLLLCLGVSLALVAGGCGDDDATADADDASSDTERDGGDSDGGDIGLTGECAFLGEFATNGLADAFDPSTALDEGGSVDFGELYGSLAKEFRQVADGAPGDIDDAFQTMADAFDTLADEVDGLTLDLSDPANIDPEAMTAFESAGAVFDDPEFEEASNEVEAWLEANCSTAAG